MSASVNCMQGGTPSTIAVMPRQCDSPEVVTRAMVGLVGHTLLESTTSLDLNNVSNLVHLEIGGEV